MRIRAVIAERARDLSVLLKKGVHGKRMRKTRWLRKAIYGLAWSFILLTGIRIVADRLADVETAWWDTLVRSVTGAVFQAAAPASAYITEKPPETLAEYLMRVVREAAPAWEYAGKRYGGDEAEETSTTVAETEGEEEWQTGEAIVLESEENEKQPAPVLAEEEALQDVPGQQVFSEDLLSPAVIGTEYPLAKLCDYDFLIRNFYAVSEITTITSGELDAAKLLGRDLTMEADGSQPQILIYHTHSQEEFIDSRPGVQEDTVIGVGDYLMQILTEHYGYSVIHDKTPYDVVEGAVDRNEAYDYAADGVERILEENPSIEVIIDLHRDGVNEGVHLISEVNGKPTAQIMFVNGISKTTLQGEISYLYNPYIEDNLAFSLMLQLKAEAYYPDFTRRIMIKAYRYNMHLRPRTLLVEVGAQTNTLQEAKNAMEPLAVMLHKTLSGEEE